MSETRAEQIERLKNNGIAWGLLPEKDQSVFISVRPENCLRYEGDRWRVLPNIYGFDNTWVYRIRPDYHEEPQDDDREIKEESGELYYRQANGIKWRITTAPCFVNFAGFWTPNKNIAGNRRIPLDHVAEEIREGKTVVARFRK